MTDQRPPRADEVPLVHFEEGHWCDGQAVFINHYAALDTFATAETERADRAEAGRSECERQFQNKVEEIFRLRCEVDHLRETAWVERCLELEARVRLLEAELKNRK